MTKHLYIYAPIGTAASALGWILQQSPSYGSDLFTFESRHLANKHIDPWDNHVDFDRIEDPESHWIFPYTSCIETHDNNFTWLDNFVDSFSARSAFGLSYGSWEKSANWNNPNVDVIVVNRTVELFNYFWQIYMCRPFDVEDVKHSLILHSHDHKSHIPGYYEWLMDTIGYDAIAQAEHTPVRFWQLQAVYHNGGKTFPSLNEEQHWKDVVYSHTSQRTISDNEINVDIFDVDLPLLCNTLDIEYTEQMQKEYDTFLSFANANK